MNFKPEIKLHSLRFYLNDFIFISYLRDTKKNQKFLAEEFCST